MTNVCILTDSTAQFTQADFPGRERVHIVPFGLSRGDGSRQPQDQVQGLISPSMEDFTQYYARLSHEYDTVFVLTLSSQLNSTYKSALSAAELYNNHSKIVVIDSQTTSVGLGLLVQSAAAAAATGAPPAEIERKMRASIPHIYMLFCIPELTFLAKSGYMDYSQALVAEMMGILPIYTIEEGRLAPMEKVRTQRHLFESFLEFINEFDAPAHIALVRGTSHNTIRTRPVRQYVGATFPDTPFSEHVLGPHLAALFGPQTTGLAIMEKSE